MGATLNLSQGYPDRDTAAKAGFNLIRTRYLTLWPYQEYAFWVVTKQTGEGGVFHFTDPVTDGSKDSVPVTKPPLPIRGYCHTHPKSFQTRFSDTDKSNFSAVQAANNGVAVRFYLMGANLDLRIADALADFPPGKTLAW
jgi:hypothetical protein